MTDEYLKGIMEKLPEEPDMNNWTSILKVHPTVHETVLFLCSNGDIYQGRGCYGMHEPWWCGHSKLNYGKILSNEGLIVTDWMHRPKLPTR